MPSAYSARSRPGNRRAKTLISLTPLIDVVFILLVFFMLASSFLDWRMVALEGADAQEVASAPGAEGAILVDIAADRGLRLSGRVVAEEALLVELATLLERRPEAEVVLRPGAGVRVQALVDWIDRLTADGIDAVSIQRGR